jgi:hypothetical protein
MGLINRAIYSKMSGDLPCIYWVPSAVRDQLVRECKIDLDECCRRYREAQSLKQSDILRKSQQSRFIFVGEGVARSSRPEQKSDYK